MQEILEKIAYVENNKSKFNNSDLIIRGLLTKLEMLEDENI